MTDLLKLAERCEQATGPDRRIDGLIFARMNPDKRIIIGNEPGRFPQKAIYGTPLDFLEMLEGDDRMADDAAEYLCAPNFTASLDAAMTLAPRGRAQLVLEQAIEACVLATSHRSDDFVRRLPAFVSAAALRARAAQ